MAPFGSWHFTNCHQLPHYTGLLSQKALQVLPPSNAHTKSGNAYHFAKAFCCAPHNECMHYQIWYTHWISKCQEVPEWVYAFYECKPVTKLPWRTWIKLHRTAQISQNDFYSHTLKILKRMELPFPNAIPILRVHNCLYQCLSHWIKTW